MRHTLPILFALLALPSHALALIYLPENSLESFLVRSDAVVIGTVTETSESDNRGTLQVQQSFKATLQGPLKVTGIMLKISTDKTRPRFAPGDQAVVFLGPAVEGTRPVLYGQRLETAAEVKSMTTCITEVMPFAKPLTDLGNIKSDFDEPAVRKAIAQLVTSKSAFTQILTGRLMATRLADRVKPEGSEDAILTGLTSKRTELLHGAIAWADKLAAPDEKIRAALKALATDQSQPKLAQEAQAVLDKLSPAATSRKAP